MGQRPPGASESTCAPICVERLENAPHRPLAQRGVAVEGGGDAVPAHHAHHQPRAGAGVAEVEHVGRSRRGRRCPTPGCASRRRPGAPPPRQARGRRPRCAARRRPPAGPRRVVSPTLSRPKISARCEIDLSPGTRSAAAQGPATAGGEGPRRAVMGAGHGSLRSLRHARRTALAIAQGHTGVTRGAAGTARQSKSAPVSSSGMSSGIPGTLANVLRRIRPLSELAFDSRHAHD